MFLLREFFLLGIPASLSVVAWTGFLGRVAWMLVVVVGLAAGVYGAIRARFIYVHIRADQQQWEELKSAAVVVPLMEAKEKEFKRSAVPPVMTMPSTIGGIFIFAAIIGFIAWGIRAVL